MISFFGNQCLRDAVVERVREHQRLDQIAQQIYWNGSKGCAIGCVLHSGEHMAFETQLGLPVFLAYMDEHIFESLPLAEAKAWPLRFIEAVPVGVDLELVFPRFMKWLLSDPDGMRQFANADTLLIIDSLTEMYGRRIEGIPFDAASVARDADRAARAAARAADSAARAADNATGRAAWDAARAADSAAWAADNATGRAAWDAARAADNAAWAADSAADSAAWAADSASWAADNADNAADNAARAADSAARAAGNAARAASINRQADYLVALLRGYESNPGEGPPCTEQERALGFAAVQP